MVAIFFLKEFVTIGETLNPMNNLLLGESEALCEVDDGCFLLVEKAIDREWNDNCWLPRNLPILLAHLDVAQNHTFQQGTRGSLEICSLFSLCWCFSSSWMYQGLGRGVYHNKYRPTISQPQQLHHMRPRQPSRHKRLPNPVEQRNGNGHRNSWHSWWCVSVPRPQRMMKLVAWNVVGVVRC